MNSTVYFNNGGKQNSMATFRAVKEAVKFYKPEAVVIGTLSGESAFEAAKVLEGMKVRVIAIPFQKNYWHKWGPPKEIFVNEAKALGVEFIPNEPEVKVLDREKPEIAAAWRVVSQGVKVGVQCATMAVDAEMIQEGSTVISIGGTKQGVDTAIVLETFGFEKILKSNIKGIIAMPITK